MECQVEEKGAFPTYIEKVWRLFHIRPDLDPSDFNLFHSLSSNLPEILHFPRKYILYCSLSWS